MTGSFFAGSKGFSSIFALGGMGPLFLLLLGRVTPASAALETVADLRNHYGDVFKSGNRNAASFLWSSYVLDRAESLPAQIVETLNRGFCPISGSPLPDEPHTRYKVALPQVNSAEMLTGITHLCCWPCICDMQDLVRVDTKTVKTADGDQKFHFLVHGNPCEHSERLQDPFTDPFSMTQETLSVAAPEVKCNAQGNLAGAVLSDGGYPIIGMFFADPAEVNSNLPTTDAKIFDSQCAERRKQGFNSGMGKIFRAVAGITQISIPGSADPMQANLAISTPVEKTPETSSGEPGGFLHEASGLGRPSGPAGVLLFGLLSLAALSLGVRAYRARGSSPSTAGCPSTEECCLPTYREAAE